MTSWRPTRYGRGRKSRGLRYGPSRRLGSRCRVGSSSGGAAQRDRAVRCGPIPRGSRRGRMAANDRAGLVVGADLGARGLGDGSRLLRAGIGLRSTDRRQRAEVGSAYRETPGTLMGWAAKAADAGVDGRLIISHAVSIALEVRRWQATCVLTLDPFRRGRPTALDGPLRLPRDRSAARGGVRASAQALDQPGGAWMMRPSAWRRLNSA
jgi:hypothetical protein